MPFSYLNNRSWLDVSREERLFCGRVYEVARRDPGGLARWIAQQSGLILPADDDWELAFEVCFYRDVLWQRGTSARASNVPQKRTFDLCLFHEQCIVIIEAKVFEAFDRGQTRSFGADLVDVPRIVGRPIDVKLVALASSRYFENHRRYGWDDTLSVFHGKVSWASLADRYSEVLFSRADLLYKASPERAVI